MKVFVSSLSAIILSLGMHLPASAQLELKKGDRVAILGNTLADRQQHHGWLEALIHRKWPDKEITIRNLGFAADELNIRVRSDGVPAPEQWLSEMKADVVFAYFGFNESFKGEAGLEKFKQELDKFIKDTLAQKYNGESAPRLVIFSPIAHEDLKSPDYPSGEATNARLALYVAAMEEVTKANQVQFVDLFEASKGLYAASSHPLTHNGLHLVEDGDKQLAPVQFKGLFGIEAPVADDPAVEKIRQAVLLRNKEWHHRYRSVDQYNIFGGRGHIAYEGITNNTTMLQELAQREVLTANRDKHIWAVAAGKESVIDDGNLPKVDAVLTNKKTGISPYLDAEEAIKLMKVAPGCKVELVASEKEFPALVNPVQMGFDTHGKLVVAVWPNYPGNTPTTTVFDKLVAFDLDPKTGKAVKATTYLDGLNCPTGFQFYKDGVIVMQSPDLWFVRDTDGDGRADWKERILNGLDAADSHHETNSICVEPGGAIYLSDGVFHRTNVETLNGPVRNTDGAIYRFEPRTNKFERYVPYGFANPHGRVFDYWGNDIITDATGNQNYFGPAFSGFLSEGKHAKMETFWKQPSRPCPGTNILTSRHFPDDWQGLFLNANVISFQGIWRAKIHEEGSGLKGETLPDDLISSTDPNFRPSAVSVAPDGSIYFCDWHNSIIGHLQHHLRDPNRDHTHGRIYRITYEGRPLLPIKKIAGESVEKLLDLLKEPENDVRNRAKIELSGRETKQVIAATQKWEAALDRNDADYEHHRLEALWVHQWHNVVNVDLLHAVLRSPDPRARAQAVRVLGYWRDRVPDPLVLIANAVHDEAPRVRLEAVRVLSFFSGDDAPKAAAIAYETLNHEMDYYLNYTFKETLRQLQSISKNKVLPEDAALLATYISKLDDGELNGLPNTEAVLLAKFERSSYDLTKREGFVKELAKLRNSTPTAELLAVLQKLDEGKAAEAAVHELTKLLVMTPADQLKASSPGLMALAKQARTSAVRRAAWAGLLVESAGKSEVWNAASADSKWLAALVEAISVVPNPELRASLQPQLAALFEQPQLDATLRRAAMRALPLMGAAHADASFEVLAKHVIDGQERVVAANALMQLPRSSWDKTKAEALATSVLAYAKTLDANHRTEQSFIELNQLGMEMASLAALPAVSKELRGLGVSVFVVKAVHEQLRFDVTRIVVEKGKPFEVVFDNTDVMPHNLVVVAPGKHNEIGMAAMTMTPDKKDKQGRQYLPEGHPFIAATHLLNPGQKEKLQLKAPGQEGEYEYVCTFPGHAMVMWGKLVVTSDVDAYLQANPNFTLPAPGAP
jgi:glucose/arabinose dehydrogenase/azurin